MHKPFSIYGTWGAHDELGDRVELSEKLAMRNLDALKRWRDRHGVAYDYFLIDCWWFDAVRGLQAFRQPQWPRGYEPVLEGIRALGMKPGLWFATNGAAERLRVPAWKASASTNNWNYSLVDGPYAEALEESLFHAAEKWHTELFKFDFAGFSAAAKGSKLSPDETYNASVKVFRGILGRLRAAFPAVKIIAHCGYFRGSGIEDIGVVQSPGADPSWLGTLDALFSGDPHPCDVPCTDLARNLDLYQDRQVWKLHRDGFPLDRVEDHGVLVGMTNTSLYRGRHGFKRTHLGQLARGGRRDFLYGDATLLTDDDVRHIRAARALYFDAYEHGLTTGFVGPGEPGVAPWHGYLTGGGGDGLLYLVNGSTAVQQVTIPLPGLFEARVLFQDGRIKPALQVQPDRLSVELCPEQMVLVGLGSYAEQRCELGCDTDAPLPGALTLLPIVFRSTNRGWVGDLEVGVPKGTRLNVVAQAFTEGGTGGVETRPERFGKQSNRKSASRRPQAHDVVRISVRSGSKVVKPTAMVPAGPVWSGISWVAKTYAVSGPCRIVVERDPETIKRLRVSAYAVTAQA